MSQRSDSHLVTVVLVAYYGDEWIQECLHSLAQASHRRLHLLLVDNAGTTRLDPHALEAFDAEILRTSRPYGFAEANNFALVNASALGKFVLFLNQDTKSPPGWIDTCIQMMEDNSELGGVSPLIRTYNDDGWDPSFLACLDVEQREALGNPTIDNLLYAPHAPAAALIVRTEVLQLAGPFDPIFGSYYEDYDLCRRIRRHGYRIAFASQARICHFSGSTTTSREKELARMRLILRNRFIHQLRESSGSRARQVVRHFVFALPRRLARGLARTSSSQPPLVTLRAFGDIARELPRLISTERDQNDWQTYLDSIGWSERFPSLQRTPAVETSTT